MIIADGVIVYREDGEEKHWRVACHAKNDNAETLRAHLKRWKPDAEFLSGTVELREKKL